MRLSKVLFLIAVILSTSLIVGCDSPSEAILKPSITQEDEPDSGTISFRRYQILYLECGTITLDYPSDFEGPIPQGHGRIGQTDPDDYCSGGMAMYIGDPTSDD